MTDDLRTEAERAVERLLLLARQVLALSPEGRTTQTTAAAIQEVCHLITRLLERVERLEKHLEDAERDHGSAVDFGNEKMLALQAAEQRAEAAERDLSTAVDALENCRDQAQPLFDRLGALQRRYDALREAARELLRRMGFRPDIQWDHNKPIQGAMLNLSAALQQDEETE